MAATTQLFWDTEPAAGKLMLPYLAWTAYATVLNGWIWNKNPRVCLYNSRLRYELCRTATSLDAAPCSVVLPGYGWQSFNCAGRLLYKACGFVEQAVSVQAQTPPSPYPAAVSYSYRAQCNSNVLQQLLTEPPVSQHYSCVQAESAASLKTQPRHTKLDEIQEEIQMQSPDAK